MPCHLPKSSANTVDTQMLDARPRCHLDHDSTNMLSRCSAHFGFREEAFQMTTDYDSVDYFTDPSLVPDPHPYYDHVRAKDPVCCPLNNGVLAASSSGSAHNLSKDNGNLRPALAVMGASTPPPLTPGAHDRSC